MSLYDDQNPQHCASLARHKARWTPEKEVEFQRKLAEQRAQAKPQ